MTEEPQKKWSCEYCTYHNWPSAIKCTLCRAPRPVQLITPTSPEAPSRELIPRSRNKSTSTAPLILPGNKAQSQQQQSGGTTTATITCNTTAAGKWQCRSCTYLNFTQAIKCSLCHLPKTAGSPSNDNSKGRVLLPRHKGQHPRSPETSKAVNNDRNRAMSTTCQNVKKWICPGCTYENWPKAKKCVLCLQQRGKLSPESTVGATSNSSTGSSSSSGGHSLIEENLRNTEASSHSPSSSSSPPHSPPLSPKTNVELKHVGRPTASASSPSHHAGGTVNVAEQEKRVKQIRRRLRKSDCLFLNACIGVVEGDPVAVEMYQASGGDPTRQLTHDEVTLLNRPSAFDIGFTLVHLAIRFQREDLLPMLLSSEVSSHAVKRPPSQVCADLSGDIRRDISKSLRQRKGDFPCYFVRDMVTFILPGEIEDLPLTVRNQLFDELLDRDVQKELEQESPIINWSEGTDRLGSRLFALWNRTAGDCLLDSVLQATWGVFDTDAVLRRALGDSLNEGAQRFYIRWKEYESMQVESLHYSLDEEQWLQDWALMLSRAGQPGAALEQIHIFALAHILRRPIIVYGVKFIKSFRGENIGYARFQGVYLPLLWEQSFCWKSPLALGYTRGHFSALVPLETESEDNLGAGANLDTSDDTQIVYLPLTDSTGKFLPVHFITPLEVGSEERLLNEWFDCCYTPTGTFVAQQLHRKRRPVLVGQMVEEWLQRYRRMGQQL